MRFFFLRLAGVQHQTFNRKVERLRAVGGENEMIRRFAIEELVERDAASPGGDVLECFKTLKELALSHRSKN